MKIGVVSNSKICIPLLSYLSSIKAGVMLYFGKSVNADISVNELAGLCRMNNIQFHAEDETKELYNWQQLNEPDIIFITGYGHKIAVKDLSGVPKGIYNIHFGRLPHYRGPSPVFWQLKNGEAQIGLTMHQLTDKLDCGAVVWEQNIRNEEYHTYNYINQAFSQLQVNGVAQLLTKLNNKQTPHFKAQNETDARYYNKPQLADVMINWDTMDAKGVLDLIKACTSWNNGAGTLINGYELKILDAEAASSEANNIPGTITIANNKFTVACINKQALSINFFNINNTCIPARHAGFYGLKTGQTFISKI
ncbi:methionyl-tRNA formyltransferase [Mucilaginibacter sp. AK015]|uniref:methionyl-tRNA formyltransferase n=1 Tax=Mucilaginibacter sp. AK015 TaxID=2723072 RepID=UPI0016225030|nr:formyltransferase family protein [Mucilaginibacter sp. AK015]MBB5395747.1 methionyl-tRNA formyltransferase [Mucilaginibacter sp. AK015]